MLALCWEQSLLPGWGLCHWVVIPKYKGVLWGAQPAVVSKYENLSNHAGFATDIGAGVSKSLSMYLGWVENFMSRQSIILSPAISASVRF